jgi:hypothetical protein
MYYLHNSILNSLELREYICADPLALKSLPTCRCAVALLVH